MPVLELSVASGDALSVRRFSVHESISSLFSISVWARSSNPSVDLEAIVGGPASIRVTSGYKFARLGGARLWTGICNHIEQVQAEVSDKGLSTYLIRIVPTLWLLTQRRNYRIFQHRNIPDIVGALLDEWGIRPDWQIARESYPKLEYKAQYGESDYDFFCRLLEEAGIAFTFPDDDNLGSKVTLSDALHQSEPRPGGPVIYVDNPNQASEREFVTRVRLSHEVRPGAHTIRDYDFRNPGFALFGEGPKAASPEDRYEQYHYKPGAFLVETGKSAETPVADDKGVARHDQKAGQGRAERALSADRLGKRAVSFDTNIVDLWPGMVFSIDNHPHVELADSAKLLVSEFTIEGTPGEEWHMSGHAVFAEVPYRPLLKTPKPEVNGVQSATVVGPPGQEIHVDEFGRVRVQFPWDREGKNDDTSSCWMRVGQGWAGTGYGMIMIPRVGQEVLVGFLEGDPDQPIIVGRVFNNVQQVPYKLPDHKTRSTWKSDSSPGGGGFNEIMFDDLKGRELVYVQAERNRRKLVKNDETMTIGHDRQKLVKNDEIERTEGNLQVWVGRDQDITVLQARREAVRGDSHLRVKGDRRTKVDGDDSLIVGKSRHERVNHNHALAAGEQIHVAAGTALVLEAASDLTLRGPGGFIRIDARGITIQGKMVWINSGGSPGAGDGAHPVEPAEALEAVTDDGSKTGIGQ